MSDLTVQSNLTAYNVDGLELFFDSNRKVRASQSAIARMCSTTDKVIAQAQIRQYIQKLKKDGEININVVEVEMLAGVCVNVHLLYDSEVIVSCLARYNPVRLQTYMRFGIDEGLAQMAGVPVKLAPTQNPEEFIMPSQEELLLLFAKRNDNLNKYLYHKPGLKSEVEYGMGDKQLALPAAPFTFADLIKEYKLVLSLAQRTKVATALAHKALLDNLAPVTKIKVPAPSPANKNNKRTVNLYDGSFHTAAVNCLKAYGLV